MSQLSQYEIFLIWFYTAQGQNIAMAQISKREAVA